MNTPCKDRAESIFGNFYSTKKPQGDLKIQNIRVGQRNYAVITEWQSTICKIQTHIPLQWGRNTLSNFDILDLYTGKSLKLGIKNDDITSGYFITPISFNVTMNRIGGCFLGTYYMQLGTIFPCYKKETAKIKGYICQNIYVPKTIVLMKEKWIVDECETAALTHYGKIIDIKTSRSLAIREFNAVKEKAAGSTKAILAQFSISPHNDTLEKNTDLIK